ncbi:hypothetical protein ACFQVD_33580 [Streptosporangium amethystogenes subsp. fukuiense]|uniref:PadR family transcriptional regulator n=1 Tax=Streptosporangium amethystogenes subsp. fukuiense TaxID=698418 RepID=A0ABW2TA02_9ACTN
MDDEPEAEIGAPLPATAYTVLGVLSVLDEELSAAEIKVRCDYTLRWFYWSPAISHIRRELRRLGDLGLVTEREVTIGRVRRSTLYQTTERGEEVLRQWVSSPPVDEPVMLKNPALLRVYLGRFTEPYELVKVLDDRLEQLEEQIKDLVWGKRRSHELGLDEEERVQYGSALGDYLLRAAHFEYGNVRQLRDRIADYDPDHPELKVTRPKGLLRRRLRQQDAPPEDLPDQ